mgnify:CR=1 FL=1
MFVTVLKILILHTCWKKWTFVDPRFVCHFNWYLKQIDKIMILALDFGGTFVKYGLVSTDYKIIELKLACF